MGPRMQRSLFFLNKRTMYASSAFISSRSFAFVMFVVGVSFRSASFPEVRAIGEGGEKQKARREVREEKDDGEKKEKMRNL